MDFQISLVGLNHRSAGVDVREKFSLADFCKPDTWPFPPSDEIKESFILSTCNRVEALTVGNTDTLEPTLAKWAQVCQSKPEDLARYIYTYKNIDAARHIFEVASSLDSMVLGEPQILGQMKKAYRDAVASNSAGVILNGLLHRAFFVAKRVRHETAVAASAVSISYAAIELAKRIFGSLPTHRALLIGAGEMAELAAMHLLQAGIDEIAVANRTYEHAETLARKFRGKPIQFESLVDNMPYADIIIASTGSKNTLINARHVKQALKARKNRPMFFIDIAVPRDIDPDVNALDNVYLYDIDDLKDVVEENMAGRREEAKAAALIIDEEVARFGEWLENLDAKPTILDIIARGEEISKIEVARAMKRFGSNSPELKAAFENLATAIIKKMNHAPITYLKKEGMARSGPAARIGAVRKMLNLDHEIKTRKP